MKHGMFQRSVSLLLALVMILGNVPMNALAAEGEETTAPACEHSYDAVTTDATCSQDGSVVYTCACGDTYTETIPATGEHAWGDWTVTAEATYEAAGLETRACGCGATEEREIPQLVAAHEHAWGDWTVAAEATYEAAGLETRTCECGETENREIPQLVKVKAELSGNTRKLYFLNTEAWEEVHVFWSFEEEDFEDVAFPGVKMEADEDLENVFVVELPVEADAVTFNDGEEVTDELLAWEEKEGIEAIHFFEAELNADLDYFSADEQVEDEENATEWLSYEDLHKAWEEAKKAEEDAAKQPVMDNAPQGETTDPAQALIDALPASVNSQEEYDAVYAIVDQLEQAGYIDGLTDEQLARAMDAINAADLWYAGEEAGNYAEEDGWYWDGTTLYIKDGKAIDLYAVLTDDSGINLNPQSYAGTSRVDPAYSAEIKYSTTQGRADRGTTASTSAIAEGLYYVVATSGRSAWTGKWGSEASFTVKHYYEIKTAVAENSPDTARITLSTENKSAVNVNKGGTIKINVGNVDGYTAAVTDSKGNAVTNLDAYAPTESTTLTVTYTSNAVSKYKVTVEEVNGDCGTATLKSDDELIAGANALVEVVTNANDANHKYEVASVKVGNTELSKNENGYYVYTMGEADVTIEVTYSKSFIEFGANKNTTIEWNGYYQDGTKLPAEDLAELKEEIFTKLDIQGVALADVNIQYYPWYTTRTQDPGYSDADGLTELDGTRQDYSVDIPVLGKVGWSFNEFGERGYKDGAKFADTKEKVRITTADGLWIDTEITLTESRGSAPVVNATTAQSKDGAAGILAAAKAAAVAAYSGYENLTFAIATENWEATVDGLAAGATANVTAQATFAGDASKVGGTVTVTVAVTKSAELAANVTYTENVDGGDVTLTKGANNAALGTGVMAADNPVRVTVNNFKYGSTNAEAYYLAGISVNGNPLPVANNAASFEVVNSMEEVKNYAVAVSYDKETFGIATSGYEIKINGFSNDTKAVNLKNLVLDEIFGENNYNPASYKVEMLTLYEVLGYDLGESYYNVEGQDIVVYGYKIATIPASWFVTQLVVDGKTENNFKITKLGSSNKSGKDLYKEDVMIVASEARQETNDITLSPLDYTENTLEDVIAAIKNNVRVNGAAANVTVALDHETPLTTTKQTYTATVTAPATEAYLESSKQFNITADISTYRVAFDCANGTAVQSSVLPYDAAITAPINPTKVGHTFTGWKDNEDKVYAVNENGTVALPNVTKGVEYTAQYTVNQYTVTFMNGGDKVFEETLEYGATITAPNAPEKEGHTFKGWNGFTTGMTVGTKNETFTANWEANKYTVTWQWTDGKEAAQELKKEYTFDTSITIPAEIPTQFEVDENTKKTIVGWEGFTANMKMPANNGLVFTATYTTQKTYTATFLSDGENYAKQVIIPTDEDAENDTVKEPTKPTKKGYRFGGWFTDAEFTTEFTAWGRAITDDITLYAKWVQQFEVTFDVEGIEKQIVDINGKATKPAVDPDKANFVFGGWQLNGVDYDFETPVTANIALTANWIADVNDNNVLDENETIAINIEGNGSVTIKGVYLVEEETVEEPAADAAVEPIAEADDTVVDAKSGNYIFNSKEPNITITAKPVVEGGFSKSYVKQIGAKGTAALTFAEDGTFAATETVKIEDADELKVVFEDVPVLKNPPEVVEYNFFTGKIPYDDIYASVITAPELVGENTTYTYFARGEMTHTVSIDSLDLDPSVKTLLNAIGITEFSFDMKELWLPLDAQIKKSVDLETAVSTYLTKEKINGLYKVADAAASLAKKDAYDKAYAETLSLTGSEWLAEKAGATAAGLISISAGYDAVKAEIETIYKNIYESAMYYDAHNFGYNASGAETVDERIKIAYSDPSMKWETEATVTLKDSRAKAFISGSDVTLTYRDYMDADLMANFGLVDEAGNPVEGEIYSVQMTDPYTFEGKNVSEEAYKLEVMFDGNENYRPAEKTFNITIVKATASLDLPNLNVTYGDNYDTHANLILGNDYGDKKEVIDSLVEIFIGLDVADATITADGKVSGVASHIQIMLPQDDTLAMIFKTLGLDVYGEEGETLSLDELQGYLDQIDDALTQFDPDNETVSGITNILSSVTGLVDLSALEITIGGSYPTDTGIYLYGAVSTSSNYETAFDVAYMVIAPETAKYTLKWNAEMPSVVTLPVFQQMDIGAKAIEDENFKAGYLILGINDETGDIYTTDIYGNIKLNVWADPAKINDNGAYVQMAYGLNYGDNKLAYAIPIVRSFAIVPGITEMEIVVDNQATADLYKTVFDNAPVDVTVRGVIPEGGQVKFHYYGIEANTKTYDSDIAPTHTGAYAITATLVTRDANGEMTSVGLDVATVVIQPTESAVTMKELETVTYDGQGHKVSEVMEIVASSTVENLKPDTTVITASIATDGSFSENGWAAVQGTVNVDFPRWMDELIAKYAPSVKDGITLSELEAKLLNKLPTITDKLEELGATNEMVNSTKNLLTNVSSLLEEMPADAVLSFKDDYEVLAVGTYAVAAVVTDSDHIPSVDAGLLVIVPDADQVFLDWDYHDENNIWSRELLSNVSINATAFNDKAFTEPNAQATAKITYQFIGLDQDAGLKIYTDPAQLPNGIYTQIAYIELEVDSQIVLSDIITRTIVIVPNMPELQIVDSRGAAQDKFEFTFDNEPVELYVKQNGQTIENQIRYIGLQTNGVEYDSTVAPVHAGAYAAITVLKTQENVGMDVALVTIAPAKSDISVTGGTVAYNGKEQTATVKAESPNSTVTSPDYTLISGTVDISAGVQNVGLESLCGDVNIDLPNWLDNVLAKTEFNQVDADVASVAKFISTYRNDLLKLIPEQMLESTGMSNETVEAIIQKLNGGIDELLKVLDKLPDDVHLTFESNKGYTELGSYFYYGIVTDSDHIPAADTGLLVIEPAAISDDDVEVTFKPVYNGKEQTVTVVVKVGEKLLEEGKDYEVTDNAAINAGKYTLTVTGKGNYTGKVTAEWAIEKASVTVTLNDKTKTYGEKDTDLTYTVNGLAVGDFAADLNIQATRKPGENVGEYAITATAKNANYNITIIDGTLTIEKADATVTINNASKVYGEEDPKFTATITGLKGDDKLNVVFSREAGQDVGEYVISATIAADDAVAKNYNITIKTGILTITQKDITTGDGYPIYFQPGDANGMIKVGTTVYVDDVAYILDENCVAWAADKNRELAIGYVYKNSGNHTTDHAYSDTTKNMYIWDLQWNEETGSYNARRVEALDNLLSFAGGSIWLGSDGVNGIRTYYSTTADTEAVKGAFRNLGYEVVTHGVVVGWADKLNGSEPVPNGNNSAAGHSAGNGTFYDEIYPAADKYITPDLRARFYVELKNIETSESKIIYSGSVERSIGYIAYQNIGRVDAQYQPYVKAILDKAAAAGFTYGG